MMRDDTSSIPLCFSMNASNLVLDHLWASGARGVSETRRRVPQSRLQLLRTHGRYEKSEIDRNCKSDRAAGFLRIVELWTWMLSQIHGQLLRLCRVGNAWTFLERKKESVRGRAFYFLSFFLSLELGKSVSEDCRSVYETWSMIMFTKRSRLQFPMSQA